MKRNLIKGMALVLAMALMLLVPVTPVYATTQGTNGDELNVVQPEKLEIQLGLPWAGVEFELKTDAGLYPGAIPVGEDGVLRLEIGGSSNYILTCLNSQVEIPAPEETQVPTMETTVPTETEEVESTAPEMTEITVIETDGTVAGIPVAHLVIFGIIVILVIGGLIVMLTSQNRQQNCESEEDEDA